MIREELEDETYDVVYSSSLTMKWQVVKEAYVTMHLKQAQPRSAEESVLVILAYISCVNYHPGREKKLSKKPMAIIFETLSTFK